MLVDDLDGGDADETVKFALDGVQYEIDLSKKNATKLRDAFAPYLGAATKVGRGGVVVGGRAAVRVAAAVPPPTGSRTRRSGSGPEEGHQGLRPGPDQAGNRGPVPRRSGPLAIADRFRPERSFWGSFRQYSPTVVD